MNLKKLIGSLKPAQLLVAILTLLLCSACQSTKNSSDRWVIMSPSGIEKATVSEPEALKVLSLAWEKKQKVKTKKTPNFEYVLQIYKDGLTTEWFYSASGYTMLKGKDKKIIYKVKLKTLNDRIR